MSKITIYRKEEFEAKYLYAKCGVRYWEDGTINGVDDEAGDLIPFRDGDAWCPLIEIDTGIIIGWPKGVEAKLHYKVCDDGEYTLLTADRKEIICIDGYVPSIMSPASSGYGDYVIMNIDGDGKIDRWRADLGEFEAAAKGDMT